jgi:hypothetical protein
MMMNTGVALAVFKADFRSEKHGGKLNRTCVHEKVSMNRSNFIWNVITPSLPS